jgi:site-specific recombinase XerD
MKNLPISNTHFRNLHKGFSEMIISKGYSRGKDCVYPSMVREFLFFMENKGITAIEQVKATDVIAYHDYLVQRPNQRREGGLSNSAISAQLFSLRIFFDHLRDIKQLDASPVQLPKFTLNNYQQRNILTVEEIKQLYSVCESKRDKALLSVAYGCGLRRSEIEKLNTADILFHKGMLIVKEGKNGKSRMLPLSDSVLKDLKEYVMYERTSYLVNNPHIPSTDQTALFINNKGTRKKGMAMNTRLKYLIEKTQNTGIQQKNITLHCLRHSIATHLLDQGAGIEFVQKFLGHALMDTAHLYSKRRKQKTTLLKEIQLSTN